MKYALLVTLFLQFVAMDRSFSQVLPPMIRVVTSNYPPYGGPGLLNRGVFDNLAILALQEAGYRVELVYRPWSRALKEVELGKADAIMAVWISEARKKWLDFSPPMVQNQMVLLTASDGGKSLVSAIDFKGVRLGLIQDYYYPAHILSSGAKIEYELNEETNLKKLIGGRIDYTVLDRGAAFYFLNQGTLSDKKHLVSVLEPPLLTMDLHIAFGKISIRGVEAAKKMSKALQSLEKKGRIYELRQDAAKQGIKIYHFN